MKKFVKVAFIAAFVAIAGYSVYTSQESEGMSELVLANVEALARYEINPDCPNGCTTENGSYCYCFKIYSNMREVRWQ